MANVGRWNTNDDFGEREREKERERERDRERKKGDETVRQSHRYVERQTHQYIKEEQRESEVCQHSRAGRCHGEVELSSKNFLAGSICSSFHCPLHVSFLHRPCWGRKWHLHRLLIQEIGCMQQKKQDRGTQCNTGGRYQSSQISSDKSSLSWAQPPHPPALPLLSLAHLPNGRFSFFPRWAS